MAQEKVEHEEAQMGEGEMTVPNQTWPDQETQAVILAGGKGTRLEEQSVTIPKPMVEVAGLPLLQHIINTYLKYRIHSFIVPVGYKKEMIFGYFMAAKPQEIINAEWGMYFKFLYYTVRVVDTGEDTMTGGRLKRLEPMLINGGPFHFTYGDGLSNVNLRGLASLHASADGSATITVVHPEGRFGRAHFSDNTHITEFGEKIESKTDWINGGWSILNPSVLSYIHGDDTNLEKDVYPLLANSGMLHGYKHEGFWKCVDTMRDLRDLREQYEKKGAVWLV